MIIIPVVTSNETLSAVGTIAVLVFTILFLCLTYFEVKYSIFSKRSVFVMLLLWCLLPTVVSFIIAYFIVHLLSLF